jgi:hypothetical protein
MNPVRIRKNLKKKKKKEIIPELEIDNKNSNI